MSDVLFFDFSTVFVSLAFADVGVDVLSVAVFSSVLERYGNRTVRLTGKRCGAGCTFSTSSFLSFFDSTCDFGSGGLIKNP